MPLFKNTYFVAAIGFYTLLTVILSLLFREYENPFLAVFGTIFSVVSFLTPYFLVVLLFQKVYLEGHGWERIIALGVAMIIAGSLALVFSLFGASGGCILAQCSKTEILVARIILIPVALFYIVVTISIPVSAYFKRRNADSPVHRLQ